MSNNLPADKANGQAQADTQLEKVEEQPPAQISSAEKPSSNLVQSNAAQPLASPAPVVPPEKPMAEPAITDQTVVHMAPVGDGQQASPATPETTKTLLADDTLPHKPSGSTELPKVAASPVITPIAEPLPDIENPYMLSGDVDRARLVAQARMFRGYVEKNAKQFAGENLKSILDMGCGEGQFSVLFARLYPDAQVVGIDRDEKAIEVARRAAKDMPNVRFEVGDILKALPAGPFDLVYESIVLQHLTDISAVLKNVYNVLKPGGRFWAKDFHPNVLTVIDHPAYAHFVSFVIRMMDKAGLAWRISENLPSLLTTAGFNVLRTEKELYPYGNVSVEGRITMAVNLGSIYNARMMMTRLLQVPVSDIEHAYREIVDVMMKPGGPHGEYTCLNTVAERPATTA